jgi:hypothetical protein
MKTYVACDAHARYSICLSIDEQGKAGPPVRVEHQELEMGWFLSTLPAGSPARCRRQATGTGSCERRRKRVWFRGSGSPTFRRSLQKRAVAALHYENREIPPCTQPRTPYVLSENSGQM